MANAFWTFVTQLVPNTLAKAEDLNTNLSGVSAGFDAVEVQTKQAIKITDTPGTVDISITPALRADKIVSFDGAGNILASIYIGNYRGNHAGVAGTVYNVRDTVKDAAGTLGLNNIYICNTTHTSTGTIAVDVANWTILLDAAAAAASAAAALVSENNAAASFTSFDNRYLGSKASDPTLDNSGGALIDGATYFDTTLNRMKVYDLGGTSWSLTTAAAVDVTVADAGGLLNGINVETVLQELAGASIPVFAAGTNLAVTLTYGLPATSNGDIYTFTSTLFVLAGATLNIDGSGAKPILTQNGNAILNEDIVQNGTYTVRNNGNANYVLMNASRSSNKQSINTSLVIGNEDELSVFAGLVQERVGISGVIYGNDTVQQLWLSNNYSLDNLGNDNAINTGIVSLISMDNNGVRILVAPSTTAGASPTFKIPLAINNTTGVTTIAEPIGFQSVYEKPPLTGGTAVAYTATVGITAYVTGTVYKVRINQINTGTATIALDGLVATAIQLLGGIVLKNGDMAANHIAELYYNGSVFILLNPTEETGTVVITATAGVGTITIDTTRDILGFTRNGTLCNVRGQILVQAISGPSGSLILNGLPYPEDATSAEQSFYKAFPISFNSVSAVSIGITCNISGSTMLLLEQTTTGKANTLAGNVIVGTRFEFDFMYNV